MGCMKCGKKTGKTSVFCDECLEKMADYPVEPNAVVHLPNRPAAPVVKKKPQFRNYFWIVEGENDNLRTKIRWLRFALVIAILGFILVLVMFFIMLDRMGQLDTFMDMLPF